MWWCVREPPRVSHGFPSALSCRTSLPRTVVEGHDIFACVGGRFFEFSVSGFRSLPYIRWRDLKLGLRASLCMFCGRSPTLLLEVTCVVHGKSCAGDLCSGFLTDSNPRAVHSKRLKKKNKTGMTQQQRRQHCHWKIHCLPRYQSRASDSSPRDLYKVKEMLISQSSPCAVRLRHF